jgi:hypothetical protein
VHLFRRRRESPITEAEAYEHSYGFRTQQVRVLGPAPPKPPAPRYGEVLDRGERIRQAFAERLDGREEQDEHGGEAPQFDRMGPPGFEPGTDGL